MIGRLTSVPCPFNRFGVPFSRVLELHQANADRTLSEYQKALEAWRSYRKAVKDPNGNGSHRRKLLRLAEAATERCLS